MLGNKRGIWIRWFLPIQIGSIFIGCNDKHALCNKKLGDNKDSSLKEIWEMDGNDTISGSAVHIVNGDTIIEDFGVNPEYSNPKK